MTTLARIVTEVPPDRRVIAPLPSGRWPLALHEVLALCDNLRDAGYEVGATIEKVDAISSALDRRLAPDIGRHLTSDLLDLDPAEVAERCRQAGIELTASAEMAQARQAFDARLATDAAASLRSNSDAIIREMRVEFDPAIDAVRNAAAVGLTAATDVRALADTADGETLAAYRSLTNAVTTLDRIAGLRTQMASTANIGPSDRPIACFIATARSVDDLDEAQDLWTGEVEDVTIELSSGAQGFARTRRPRLGGSWLALVGAGYELHLNGAAEADALVTTARRASVG